MSKACSRNVLKITCFTCIFIYSLYECRRCLLILIGLGWPVSIDICIVRMPFLPLNQKLVSACAVGSRCIYQLFVYITVLSSQAADIHALLV